MTGRLVVLASGSGSNLQALIDATADGRLDAEVVGVIVNRRSAFARERAARAGIPEEFRPMGPYRERFDDTRAAREAYDADLAERVAAMRPDAIVLAGWMHLFTSAFLERFPDCVINLHPALPGEFPGAHAIDDAWAAHENNGLARTGVMVHFVPDEGVDSGPPIAAREVPILDSDDLEALASRIHEVEHELLVESVASVLAK